MRTHLTRHKAGTPMSRWIAISLTITALTFSGCGDGDESVEGPSLDASNQVDGGQLDSNVGDDTSTAQDVGVDDTATPPVDVLQDKDVVTPPDTAKDPDTATDPDTGADPDTATDPDTAADPDTVTDPDTAADPDAGTDPDAATDPDAGADPDAGTPVDGGGGDTVVGPVATLCDPCSASAQCSAGGNDGAVCVDQGDAGAFCGTKCTDDADCDAGYLCKAVESVEGAKVLQCVPKPDAGGDKDSIGTCACSKSAIAQALSTTCYVSATDKDGKLIGKCAGKRACGEKGLSACDGKAPAPETCNTIDDDCDDEVDELTCEDGNACTTDACTKAGCENKKDDGAPCDDGDACTKPDLCADGACVAGKKAGCDDGNPCTKDACDAASGECSNKNEDDGAKCDDGDLCTEKDACNSGSCAGAAKSCDDDNACTKDSCDLQSGCTSTDDDGASCDDGSKCTDKDACKSGSCAGKEISCDDGNACTKDACDPKDGCSNEPLTNAPCDDGNLCTQSDTCEKGICSPGKAADCNDDNPCTKDGCDDKTGQCSNAPADGACDDGDACTAKDACKDGKCAAEKVDCDDKNPCTDDTCDTKTGCSSAHNTAPCDDEDKCTDKDVCKAGACAGTPLAADVCDDGNLCTKDSCNAKTGCESVNDDAAKCDDGDKCTDGDTCSGGECKPGKSVCQCKENADCKDDGNLCNGTPICKANTCETDPKTVVKCDGSKDTDCKANTCAAKTGKCALMPAKEGKPCADGNKCTLDNTCKAGSCADGAKPKCNDGNACTTDLCDKASGGCSTKAIPGCKPCKAAGDCNDGNPCTKDACTAGKCTAAPIPGCIVGPDLVAVSVKSGSPSYVAGSLAAYVAVTKNGGMANSGPYVESIWLSADDKIDKSDILLKDVGRPSLAAGKSTTTGSTIKLPDATKGGTWHLLLQLDRAGKVKEGNEKNNVVAYKLTIKDKPKLIDLKPTYLKTSTATYPAGAAMYTYYWDANVGKATAPTHGVRFYLSTDTKIDAKDKVLKSFNVSAIGAGKTRKSATWLYLPLNLKPGTWYIGFWTDPDNKIYEISDANNVRFYKITVKAPADLKPAELKLSKSSIKPGSQFTLTLTESNIGGWASGNYYDTVYLSKDATITTKDKYLKNLSRPTLAAGGKRKVATAITLPTLTKPGTWYVGVIMDRYNKVKEGDEKNNTIAFKIVVTAAADLNSFTLTSDKAVYKPGDTAKLSFGERNLGSASSGGYTSGFYISPNATISLKDKLLKNLPRVSLAPGKVSYGKIDVVLPKTLATGTWYLGLYADNGSKVAESNEGNNTRYWKITISPTGKAIDLQPTYFKSTKSWYYAKNTVTVNFTEKNNGNVSSGSFTTGFYLSTNTAITTQDTYLGKLDRVAIDPGKSAAGKASFKLPSPLKPGTWYLGVISDYKNVVKEATESNNTRWWKITIYGTSDLKSVAFKSTKKSYRVGERVNLAYSDKNIGTANSPTYYDGFYLSTDKKLDSKDKLVRSVYRGGLKVNQQVNATSYFYVPAGTKPGTYHLIHRVDRTNKVNELDETNNMRTYEITVLPTPDLQAISVKSNKTTYTPGETISVDYTEKNGGTGKSGAYVTSFYLSKNTAITTGDVHMLSKNRPSLDPDKTAAAKATWKVPTSLSAGTWYLALWVDRPKKIVESNESNNIKYIKITIKGSADLKAHSISTSKKSYSMGQNMLVTFYEKNIGNVSVGPYLDGFYLSADAIIDPTKDKLLKSLSRSGLGAGKTSGGKTYVYLPLGTKPGTWHIGLYVDRYDQIGEADEKNNAKSYKITVLPSPDLHAISVKTSKAKYKAGELVKLTFVEKNLGGAATGGYYDGFWLSKDTKLGKGDIFVRNVGRASLAAGKQVTGGTSFYLSTATAAGKWNIIFFADRTNGVKETNESNNHAHVEITVTPGPELAAQEMSSKVTDYKAGDVVKATYKSQNIGGLSSTWYYDSWYLSKTEKFGGGSILLKNVYRKSLAPTKTYAGPVDLKLPGLIGKGTWYLIYRVDRTNRVKEANESNNFKALKIQVK